MSDASAKANIQHTATKVTNRDLFISGVRLSVYQTKLLFLFRNLNFETKFL